MTKNELQRVRMAMAVERIELIVQQYGEGFKGLAVAFRQAATRTEKMVEAFTVDKGADSD